eukprot:COSAG05_NODE_554_length_8710_cov_178.656137_5_plen_91_part_00
MADYKSRDDDDDDADDNGAHKSRMINNWKSSITSTINRPTTTLVAGIYLQYCAMYANAAVGSPKWYLILHIYISCMMRAYYIYNIYVLCS